MHIRRHPNGRSFITAPKRALVLSLPCRVAPGTPAHRYVECCKLVAEALLGAARARRQVSCLPHFFLSLGQKLDAPLSIAGRGSLARWLRGGQEGRYQYVCATGADCTRVCCEAARGEVRRSAPFRGLSLPLIPTAQRRGFNASQSLPNPAARRHGSEASSQRLRSFLLHNAGVSKPLSTAQC